jgi:hypothetical protein
MIMMPYGWPWSSLQLTDQADFWHPTGSYQGTGSRLRHARTRGNHDRKGPHIERLRSPTDAGKADLARRIPALPSPSVT